MNEHELTENELEFLRGLERLSRKTKVVISGCGCCGSPFILIKTSMSKRAGYACSGTGSDVIWLDPDEIKGKDWDKLKGTIRSKYEKRRTEQRTEAGVDKASR